MGIFRRNSGRDTLGIKGTLHRTPSVREAPTSNFGSGSLHRTASSPASMSPECSPECSRDPSPLKSPSVGHKTIASHMLTPPASPSKQYRKLNFGNITSFCSAEVPQELPSSNKRSPCSSYGQPTPPGSPSRSYRYYTEPNTPSPLTSPSASFKRVSSSKSLSESPSRTYCNGKVIHCPSHTPPASPMKSCRKRSSNISQLTPPESPLHFLRNKNKSLQEVGQVYKFGNTPVAPCSKENKSSLSASSVTASSITTTLKNNITLRKYKFYQRDAKSLDLSTHEENAGVADKSIIGQLQSVPASPNMQSSDSKQKGSPSRFCQVVTRLLPHLKSLNSSSKHCKQDRKQQSTKSQVSLYVDKEGRSTLISTPDNLCCSGMSQDEKIDIIREQISFPELNVSEADTQVGIFKVCSHIQTLRKDSRLDLELDTGIDKELFIDVGIAPSSKTSEVTNNSNNLTVKSSAANIPNTNIIINPIFNLESKYITDSLCNEPFKANDKKINSCTAFLKDDIIYIETTENNLFSKERNGYSNKIDCNQKSGKENLNTKKVFDEINAKTNFETKNYLDTKHVKTNSETMNVQNNSETKIVKPNSETQNVKINSETKSVKTSSEAKSVKTNSETKNVKTNSETTNVKANSETTNVKINLEINCVKTSLEAKSVTTNSESEEVKSMSEYKNINLPSVIKNTKKISDKKNIRIFSKENLHQDNTKEDDEHKECHMNFMTNDINKNNSTQLGSDNKCAAEGSLPDKVSQDKTNKACKTSIIPSQNNKISKSDVSENLIGKLSKGNIQLAIEEIKIEKNEESKINISYVVMKNENVEDLEQEMEKMKIKSSEKFGMTSTNIENGENIQTISNEEKDEPVTYQEDRENEDKAEIQPKASICKKNSPESKTLIKSDDKTYAISQNNYLPTSNKQFESQQQEINQTIQNHFPDVDSSVSPSQSVQKFTGSIIPLKITSKITQNSEESCKPQLTKNLIAFTSSEEEISLKFQYDITKEEKIISSLMDMSKEGTKRKEFVMHNSVEGFKILQSCEKTIDEKDVTDNKDNFEATVKQQCKFENERTDENKIFEPLIDHKNTGTTMTLHQDDKSKNNITDESRDSSTSKVNKKSYSMLTSSDQTGIRINEQSKDSTDNNHHDEKEAKCNLNYCKITKESEILSVNMNNKLGNVMHLKPESINEGCERSGDGRTVNNGNKESEESCKGIYFINEHTEERNISISLFSSNDNERFNKDDKNNDDQSMKTSGNSNLLHQEKRENFCNKTDEFTILTCKGAPQDTKSEMTIRYDKTASELLSCTSQKLDRQEIVDGSEHKIKEEPIQRFHHNNVKEVISKERNESLIINPVVNPSKLINIDQSIKQPQIAQSKKIDQEYHVNDHSARPMISSPPPIPPRRDKNPSSKVHPTPPPIPPRKCSTPLLPP